MSARRSDARGAYAADAVEDAGLPAPLGPMTGNSPALTSRLTPAGGHREVQLASRSTAPSRCRGPRGGKPSGAGAVVPDALTGLGDRGVEGCQDPIMRGLQGRTVSRAVAAKPAAAPLSMGGGAVLLQQ
jgi:hypothetical protein